MNYDATDDMYHGAKIKYYLPSYYWLENGCNPQSCAIYYIDLCSRTCK